MVKISKAVRLLKQLLHKPTQNKEYEKNNNEMAHPQFYIQLVYRLHFGTWILMFGPFW